MTELAVRGSSIAVVIFVVASTLGVGLSLTPTQILAPLKDFRVVGLTLVANFVAAPLVALGLWHLFGLDEPLGVGLLLCGLAAGAPFLIKLSEFARADAALTVGLMVAGQNFADPRVTVMITVVLIAEFSMLIPFSRFLARSA